MLAHCHLGSLCYGTLTIAGIGSKMLPAFLGLAEHADSQAAPPAYRRIGWLLSLGLVALAVGAPFRLAWLVGPVPHSWRPAWRFTSRSCSATSGAGSRDH